jgi:hypothetical protein
MPPAALNLTKPAFLAAISYVILAFAILLPFNIGDGIRYSFGYRFLLFLLMLVPIILSVYSVNCMWVGKCYIWSWVNAVVIAAWVMLFILAVVLASSRSAYQVGNLTVSSSRAPMERFYERYNTELYKDTVNEVEPEYQNNYDGFVEEDNNEGFAEEVDNIDNEGFAEEVDNIDNEGFAEEVDYERTE